jgi:hypothetical protein
VSAARVDLLNKHNDWEAFERDLTVSLCSRLLHPRQAYYVEIVLVLPETSLNKDSGMFGVHAELLSSTSATLSNIPKDNGNDTNDPPNHDKTTATTPLLLARSRRSVRFPHVSGWIAIIEKVILLVPLLLGACKESKTVVVSAFGQYVESKQHPLVSNSLL